MVLHTAKCYHVISHNTVTLYQQDCMPEGILIMANLFYILFSNLTSAPRGYGFTPAEDELNPTNSLLIRSRQGGDNLPNYLLCRRSVT